MKRIIILSSIASLLIIAMSCDRGDLTINPNAASPNSVVNPDLFVNRLTNEIYNGGGTLDKYPNYQSEGPWSQAMRWNQYYVSNYSYYWGGNAYNWTNSSNAFSMLKYALDLQDQVIKQGPVNLNADAYQSFVKFFKAYSFIWYTQRVGDIPMSQAGNTHNFTPIFDTQHDVYKNCLVLLDSANTLMGGYIKASGSGNALFSPGDIYGLTNLQWQRIYNTYKLRILISLSKRADDNADLNIKTQFAAILNDPVTYPILTGSADNMTYKFNATYNPYPIKANGDQPYSIYTNVSQTVLGLTTVSQDPRTFVFATPAPWYLSKGIAPTDFAAYKGSYIDTVQSTLLTNSTKGYYSFVNYRYYASADGSTVEPYTVIGYSEMCFNIAEGINRGWATGSSSTWYTNGINASLAVYGLKDGLSYNIYDKTGGGSTKTPLGTAVISVSNFLTNVAYQGDNANGLQQILEQKYISMWQNSGWEPYYNWRRTGVPSFIEGGPGIQTSGNVIQRRWLYDNNEIVANTINYTTALQNQFAGTDDVMKDLWIVK